LRMDTNVNVLGSNSAAEAYLRDLKIDTNSYPNTYSDGLRDVLAEFYGIRRDNLVAGNGSDEMLNTIYTTFITPERRSACRYALRIRCIRISPTFHRVL